MATSAEASVSRDPAGDLRRERDRFVPLAFSAADEVHALLDGGVLDEERIETELGTGNRAFVIDALSLRAELPVAAIERIVAAHSAQPMPALAWKAGLPMGVAVKLQKRLAGISSKEILQPRNLTEYPLSEDAMAWQLDLYGG